MAEIPVISCALFLVAALTTGLAIYGFASKKVQGAREFSLLMVAVTLYVAGFGMEIQGHSVEYILFWLKIEYLGITTIPAFCVVLALRLTGRREWLTKWPVRLFLLFSLVTLAIYLTNDIHHLFYRNITGIKQVSFFNELDKANGPWYYINLAYLNLGLLAGVILFGSRLKQGGIERRQAAILIAGSVGPWIAHLIYQSQLTRGFDVGPFGFLLTAPLFAWGVFGNHMVFLLPRARDFVYQSFSDAVLVIDNHKILIDFNTTATGVFRSLNRRQTGRPAMEAFPDFPEIADLIRDTENRRIQVRLQIEKAYRTFVVTSSDVRTRRDELLGTVIVLHEITDQVFLLDNLRENEERYRLIFENSPVGILQYDNTGRITTCNEKFVSIIGSSKEIVTGLNMLNLPDQGVVKAVESSLNGVMGYYEAEYHSVTAMKVTPVRGFFAPITAKDGQIRGGVGIIEDFTDRFRKDQELRFREEFENILIALELDFINTGILEMDDTFQRGLGQIGAFCKVDRAYIFRIDHAKGTMSNSHEWCGEGINPEKENLQDIPFDALPRWMEKLNAAETIYIPDLSDLSPEWQAERDILEPQGIKSLIVVPMVAGGELLGFAGFDSVVVKRTWTRDEIALLKVLGQIFASVIRRKEAGEELLAARDRAEEANRVKSAFLANMSHEIRTPLNGILGFAELIQSEATDPDILKYSDIIFASGNRLLQTLSQILDLSKVESGNMDLLIEPVDVDQIIDEVVALFTPAAVKKGLEIRHLEGADQMVLMIDEQLFRNSLTNLASNAIKFTKEGEITFLVSEVQVGGRPYLQIRVRDTGIGISQEHQSVIFEDFRQVSEGSRRSSEGTGLGLALTRKFVNLLGGDVGVESQPGKGTTFILSFPDPVKK